MRPPPPLEDREAVGIRFGCGALFGLVLGLGGVYELTSRSLAPVIVSALVVALVCGLFSARHGERFWSGLSGWLRWW